MAEPMDMKSINRSAYIDILTKFCNEGGINLIEKSGYDQGPYIPYAFNGYGSAPLKVFYCGLDTFGWVAKNDLVESYRSDNLVFYLDKNMECMTAKKILDWKNSTSFWGTTARIQLMLRTGIYYSDICHLTDHETSILQEIGYSNLNSVETFPTLDKRDFILKDRDAYIELHKRTLQFTSLKNILDTYNPDIVFILTWTDSDNIFDGLDYRNLDNEYKDKLRSVFISPTRKTKIIWTTHPTSFSFKRTNMEKMVKYLVNSYDRIKNY